MAVFSKPQRVAGSLFSDFAIPFVGSHHYIDFYNHHVDMKSTFFFTGPIEELALHNFFLH